MKLDTPSHVKEYLVKTHIAAEKEDPVVENLSGGVSCSVWKVTLNGRHWVLKQALDRLNVKEDWFSDVKRIHREHEVMQALNNIIAKGTVPVVLHTDYHHHVYMMESVEEAMTWKELLMQGDFNKKVAQNAGYLLKNIHSDSTKLPSGIKAALRDLTYFSQLRLNPFHRSLIQKYPALLSSIQALINELIQHTTCLVHGDFSPKNMLVRKNCQIVLIDFEVAHWGNPVFDLAYCIGHLMLKGWFLEREKDSLGLIRVFLSAYGDSASNLIPHLGLMLLARIDGKSPVNYIKDESMKNIIRRTAISWILEKSENPNVLQTIQSGFDAE